MAASVAILFLCYNPNFCPFYAKKSSKVLPFEKMYLLLRCILSKVEII